MSDVVAAICNKFPISNYEYEILEKEFGKLTKFASHDLKRKNIRNNYIDDFEDVNQELSIAVICAGSYYKRQVYIKKCFEVANEFVDDELTRLVLQELQQLWDNRKRHGARRQKFGAWQEELLDKIVETFVPIEKRPIADSRLEIDKEFRTYCKTSAWNAQKGIGRKISKERIIRIGLVSLSEYEYLSGAK